MTFEELKQRANAHAHKSHNDEEHRLQCDCVTWFRVQYPDLVLFAPPNGGRRDIVTGARLKAEGVVAGVADLILLEPNANYHALCIEMKTAKGRQSDSQKAWQEAVTKHGYLYVVVRSFDDFRTLINNYLSDKI